MAECFWNKSLKKNENWRQWYNKELMQLFGDLDILPFVRISRLNWIGHVNRMDSTRKVSQVFNNNPQGSRVRGRPKTGWRNRVRILIGEKWKTGERVQKTKLTTGRSPLRRRRSALDCSAIEEEEEEEEEDSIFAIVRLMWSGNILSTLPVL